MGIFHFHLNTPQLHHIDLHHQNLEIYMGSHQVDI